MCTCPKRCQYSLDTSTRLHFVYVLRDFVRAKPQLYHCWSMRDAASLMQRMLAQVSCNKAIAIASEALEDDIENVI